MTQLQQVPEKVGGEGIEAFEYPESSDAPFAPAWNGCEDAPYADAMSATVHDEANPKPGAAEFEKNHAEDAHRTFEAGRSQGMKEGREAERAAHAVASSTAEEKRIRQAASLVAEFDQQRGHYFQAVEQEVVKLALAVAARILRREAQTDPLLLMGAVRVALGQLAASTEVRLRVPPGDLELWSEAIALLPNPGTKPLVVAGEGMRLGECVIETELGNANLGIPSQLVEVERSTLNQRVNDVRKNAEGSDILGAIALEVSP